LAQQNRKDFHKNTQIRIDEFITEAVGIFHVLRKKRR